MRSTTEVGAPLNWRSAWAIGKPRTHLHLRPGERGHHPRHLHEWVGGVNWYLNRLLRISGDYGNTAFGGGAAASAGGNKLPEKTFILRFQINFGQI